MGYHFLCVPETPFLIHLCFLIILTEEINSYQLVGKVNSSRCKDLLDFNNFCLARTN